MGRAAVLRSSLLRPLARYARWLHTRWPAGSVEPLPVLEDDGATRVAGLYVVGDLTGIPLLKLALESGVRAVRAIVADPSFARERMCKEHGTLDVVIVGAGVSGMAAAREAQGAGLALRGVRGGPTVPDDP